LQAWFQPSNKEFNIKQCVLGVAFKQGGFGCSVDDLLNKADKKALYRFPKR